MMKVVSPVFVEQGKANSEKLKKVVAGSYKVVKNPKELLPFDAVADVKAMIAEAKKLDSLLGGLLRACSKM